MIEGIYGRWYRIRNENSTHHESKKPCAYVYNALIKSERANNKYKVFVWK